MKRWEVNLAVDVCCAEMLFDARSMRATHEITSPMLLLEVVVALYFVLDRLI